MNKNYKKTAVAIAILGMLTVANATELANDITGPINSDNYILNGNVSITSTGATLIENNSQIDLNGNTLTLEANSPDNPQGYFGIFSSSGSSSSISGPGSVVIKQNGIGHALGYGADVSISADHIEITAKNGRAVYRDNTGSGQKTTILDGRDTGTISLNSETDDAVFLGGDGKITIKNFKDLTINSQKGGFAINNDNGGELTITNGGTVTLQSGERGALSSMKTPTSTSQKSSLTTINAENINILANIDNDKDENTPRYKSVVSVTDGELTLNATNNLTISVTKAEGQQNVNAIAVTNGTMAIRTGGAATVNGDINATGGELKLNGNMVFNGETANIAKLGGDKATFTVTDTNQKVTIKQNDNNSLTVAGTGSFNDNVNGNLNKLVGEDGSVVTIENGANGTTAVLQEGMYNGEISAKLNAEGQIDTSTVVQKTNSIMRNTLNMATGSTLSLNRILMNDVRKRLGDIRSSDGTNGAWVRYDGGRLAGEGLSNKFNTIQVGFDTALPSNNFRVGVSASYTDGDVDYTRGSADMDAYSLAFYGTWMGDNGMFADVIARIASVENDMTVDGNKKGSLDNTAYGISGEFGWRFDVADDFYVEPQIEASYTYIDSDKISLSNSSATYSIDSVDSLIGRTGFAAGWKCPDKKGDIYIRASAVHEFLGDSKITGGNGTTFRKNGKDTWVEFGIGANFNITPSTYLWADIERTEGADIDEDWRATVGVRHAF